MFFQAWLMPTISMELVLVANLQINQSVITIHPKGNFSKKNFMAIHPMVAEIFQSEVVDRPANQHCRPQSQVVTVPAQKNKDYAKYKMPAKSNQIYLPRIVGNALCM